MRQCSLLLLMSILLVAGAGAGAADVMNLPMPRQYIEDLAGLIDAEHTQQLLGLLQELEQKTGAQVIVLTVATLEGKPVEQVAIHLAHDLWHLGQKGKDNGVLVLVSRDDREYRIEVGYGLEGILTDSVAGTIGRQFFVPNFKAGNYGLGIYQGVAKVAEVIAQDAGVTLSGMPNLPGLSRSAPSWLPLVSIVVFFLIFFVLAPRGPLGWLLFGLGASSAFRGWSGGSSRGGSSFGGGFGSFGGGGGGGFGGGGASGRW